MNEKFIELVKSQFIYGGQKYAHSTQKESTDILVDDFGLSWLLGTMAKYTFRYKNLGRERDILKIACYSYILFLKLGYHISPNGTANENYTTVNIKDKYFSEFTSRIEKYQVAINIICPDKEAMLQSIYNSLCNLKNRINISEDKLFEIFCVTEKLWSIDGFNLVVQHDTDTYNKDDKSPNGKQTR